MMCMITVHEHDVCSICSQSLQFSSILPVLPVPEKTSNQWRAAITTLDGAEEPRKLPSTEQPTSTRKRSTPWKCQTVVRNQLRLMLHHFYTTLHHFCTTFAPLLHHFCTPKMQYFQVKYHFLWQIGPQVVISHPGKHSNIEKELRSQGPHKA